MKVKKHIVLKEDERLKLLQFVKTGKPNQILHANIILMSDKGFTPKKICEALGTTKQTVNNVKNRYLDMGADKFTVRKNAGKAPYPGKITGDVEAKIVALACSKAPEGRARWTLQLLSDKSVELKYIDSISDMSIHRLLKKQNSNPT